MTRRTTQDVMNLAKGLTIHPDALIGGGNGIVATGMPGAGKTALIARFFEEFDKFNIPGCLYDLEGDLASLVPYLKRGFLATATNCPTPRDIYADGLTVVYNLATWRDERSSFPDEATGSMIAHNTASVMREASGRPPHLRVPFLIGLDEATYWLPSSIKNSHHCTENTMRELLGAFQNVAIRGRKYGVVPFFFTQKYSMLNSDVLTPGTFIFMKQTDSRELTRYIDNINTLAFGPGDLTHKQIRTRFMSFRAGEAVVKLPSGEQKTLRFYDRQSEHSSHTPSTQSAMNMYAAAPSPKTSYGAFLDEDEMGEQLVASDDGSSALTDISAYSVSTTTTKTSKPRRKKPEEIEPKVRELLATNKDASLPEIAAYAGCSPRTAWTYKQKIVG